MMNNDVVKSILAGNESSLMMESVLAKVVSTLFRQEIVQPIQHTISFLSEF